MRLQVIHWWLQLAMNDIGGVGSVPRWSSLGRSRLRLHAVGQWQSGIQADRVPYVLTCAIYRGPTSSEIDVASLAQGVNRGP